MELPHFLRLFFLFLSAFCSQPLWEMARAKLNPNNIPKMRILGNLLFVQPLKTVIFFNCICWLFIILMHGLHARFISDIKNSLAVYAILFPIIKKKRKSAYTYHTSYQFPEGRWIQCVWTSRAFGVFWLVEKTAKQVKHCRNQNSSFLWTCLTTSWNGLKVMIPGINHPSWNLLI